MIRLLPRSLAGQLALLLVTAVVAAQVITLAVLAGESSDLRRAVARTQVADRVATLVRVIEAAPTASREAVVQAFGSRRNHYWTGNAPLVPADAMGQEERQLARRVQRLLPSGARDLRIRLADRSAEAEAADAREQSLRPQALELSIRLADGTWLNGEAPLRLPTAWTGVWLSLVLVSVLAVIAAVLVAVRWITRPLTALAQAADRVGRGEPMEPLAMAGPAEITRTVKAFAVMQERLSRFLADRMAMLAAISHDLRTPITAARLRAEMIDDVEVRNAIVQSLTHMQDITEATLSFAREEGLSEEARPVDLAALVEAAAEDLRASGHDVRVTEHDALPYRCKPALLRRALTNVAANAAQYGGRALVSIRAEGDRVQILVDDEGPGLPDDQLEAVFEPFVRGDASRNGETGGIGLGLPIARSILRAHGGDIVLINRKEGLRAVVTLPRPLPVGHAGDLTGRVSPGLRRPA